MDLERDTPFKKGQKEKGVKLPQNGTTPGRAAGPDEADADCWYVNAFPRQNSTDKL